MKLPGEELSSTEWPFCGGGAGWKSGLTFPAAVGEVMVVRSLAGSADLS